MTNKTLKRLGYWVLSLPLAIMISYIPSINAESTNDQEIEITEIVDMDKEASLKIKFNDADIESQRINSIYAAMSDQEIVKGDAEAYGLRNYMKTRCPACGAENSLDALINHDEARECLFNLMQIGGDITKATIQYLGLFRPKLSSLSMTRMNNLLQELLPSIQAQEFRFSGDRYIAPIDAWLYGFNTVVNARSNLTLPLKSHGYLYKVMSEYKGETKQYTSIKKTPNSKSLNTLSILEGMKS